ncbi:MAG: tetratricopeptide repeat protein [candidate division FCPU426 bacterium]
MTRKPTPVSPGKQQPFPLLLTLLLAAWLAVLAYYTFRVHPTYLHAWLPVFQLDRFGPLAWSLAGPHLLVLLKNIFLALAWLAAAWGVGLPLRRLLPVPAPRLEEALESLGLGLAAWMLLLFILGALGLYYSWLMACLLLPAAAWGAWLAWRERSRWQPRPGWLLGRPGWAERGVAMVVALFGLFVAAMALTPEVFFDSLVYHLAVPEAWIQRHGFALLPYNFFSNFPMGMEVLYAGSLLLSDESLCRLLHAALGWLAGLATFSLGRRWFGRWVGLWAMGLFLAIPVVVMNQLVSGVDVAAVFFLVLGVNRFWAWALGPEAPEAESRPGLLVAGLLMGAALGVKYNSVFLLAPAVLSGLFIAWRQGRAWPRLLRAALMTGAAAAILVLPWMAKSAVYTGNPVYPFLYRWLPSRHLHPEKMQQQMDGFKEYGRRTWVQYLRQPWDLTFYQPTSNSYIGQTFLFILPGLLILAWAGRRGPPGLWCFLATALLAVLAWSSQTQITRYLIPVFPVLAVLAGVVLSRWQARHRVLGMLGLAGVLGFWIWSFGVTLGICLPNYDPFGVLLGREPRWAYLDRRLMNTYAPMARQVNALPPESRVLIFGETRSYYFERPVTAATVYDYNPLLEWIAAADSAETVWRRLKQEGYTHVLVHEAEAARTRGYEPYRWNDAAVQRWQELAARYWRETSAYGQLRLFSVREQPDLSRPVKAGKPLFTFDPELVGKLMWGYQQALAVLQKGDYEGVRVRWQKLTEMAPDWGKPYADLGWLSLQTGQQEQAFAYYQQADRLLDLDAGSYNNLGVLYLRHNDPEAAKRCFRQALDMQPDLAAARENLERLEGK